MSMPLSYVVPWRHWASPMFRCISTPSRQNPRHRVAAVQLPHLPPIRGLLSRITAPSTCTPEGCDFSFCLFCLYSLVSALYDPTRILSPCNKKLCKQNRVLFMQNPNRVRCHAFIRRDAMHGVSTNKTANPTPQDLSWQRWSQNGIIRKN